jgi:hypothetical protein
MSLSILKAELNGRIGKNLMPSRWLVESLISWCREVAKHEDGVLDPEADDELFNMMNSFIELLLAHDIDHLNHFRENRATLFEPLAVELDETVRKELVSRVIGYDIDRKAREDLFREHFPESLGTVVPTTERPARQQTPLPPNPLNQSNSEND